MKDPIISWYIKDFEGNYVPREEYHAGEYNNTSKLLVQMQIWNNRWGVEDVKDLNNPVLNFYFDTIEDSSLLGMCKISINEFNNMPLVITGQKASVSLLHPLKGLKNDGTILANSNNFTNVTFEFDANDYRLKENDLKNVYFELISMD